MGKPTTRTLPSLRSYKRTIKNILTGLLVASILVLTGCDPKGGGKAESDQTVDTVTKELQQNDYRGGVVRTQALQDGVIKIMDGMKSNNTIIRQDNPNSYWTTDGYQDFVSTFLNTAIINDTQWFNEEETSWDAILSQIVSTKNSFVNYTEDGSSLKSDVSIVRNEKDDYSVLNVPTSFYITLNNANYSLSDKKANYRILYDCDKDWCKAYSALQIDSMFSVANTIELFEYQRINNDTFIVQTSKERLMVVLAPVDADTDIRNREVKEFYYSKLISNGYRTTYKPFELLPETDSVTEVVLSENKKINEAMTNSFPYTNLNGDLCDRYGGNDSMFFRSPQEITRDWVFEDKALQQGIVYKDGILVVTTYNKLSTCYERFIYSRVEADTSGLSELEALVEIENLVGVQSVEIKKPEKESDTSGNNENSSGNSSHVTSAPVQSKPTSSAAGTDSNISDATESISSAVSVSSNSETSKTSGAEGE